MKNSTKKAFTGVGLLLGSALTAAGVSEGITELLVREAMDRNEPGMMRAAKHRLAGKKPAVSPKAIPLNTLEPGTVEQISVTTEDGIKLAGHWYPCEKPERVILAMHGWRSSWDKDFGGIAGYLHERGCNVLFAEQRSMGESGGKYIGFGMLERYDCLKWIQWITDRAGSDLPIYLYGISMGATSVMMASALELPENVRGIIADCGFTSADDIWKHVCTRNLHVPYRKRAKRISYKCQKRIGYGSGDETTVRALKNCHTPILFIHGDEDTFVPISMTCRNFAAAAGPKRMVTFAGAGHGESYRSDPEKYQQTLSDFWSACEARMEDLNEFYGTDTGDIHL